MNSNSASVKHLAYIGSKPASKEDKKASSRDSDSWFTPKEYLDMVKDVIGHIDVDPFSSRVANKTVKASKIFTKSRSALRYRWLKPGEGGTVFMNPPYSRELIKPSVDRFMTFWEEGCISEAVVLTNNATETQWFHRLLEGSSAICVVKGRIGFENTDGKRVSGNTRGQIFFYFGNDTLTFGDVFKEIGKIYCS